MSPDQRFQLHSNSEFAGAPIEPLGGRYRLERRVGVGGMATVFQATDLKHQRTVALKVMHRELYDSLGAQRFLREITIAANLTHPHIVPLHDSGEVDGMLYYVMPFVDGPTLRTRMRTEGTLAVGEAVRILRDVADALGAAHEQGVVHRDVKPENIMLLGRSAVVADFGVAKALTGATGRTGRDLTVTGMTAGTPAYMAPEQVAADPGIDRRADLYALGVVAYEMFTGATPFAGRTPTQLAAAIMTEEPFPLATKRPDLPAALAALVSRLLAKDPAERPSNAGQVVDALDALDIRSSTVTGQVSTDRKLRGWQGAPAIVGAVLLIAIGAYVIRSHRTASAAGSTDNTGLFLAVGKPATVAVLPFVNTSGDTANEHFSDGLTDELIAALEKVPGLRVSGRASVFALKHTSLTLRAQAETLGVQTLIEGGVRGDGGRIRVTVRLAQANNDSTLWSARIDRQVADVYSVQEEIAESIVSAMHARADGAEAKELVGHPTSDVEAHELYLRGLYDAATLDAKRLRLAVTELSEATRRDTAYAPAYAALADAYVRSSTYGFIPVADALPAAIAAADRAIALDPSLGDAYASKGFILMQRRSFTEAQKALQRAIELKPNSVWAHHNYSLLLTLLGQVPEAVRENNIAIVLDPLSAPPRATRGVLLLLKGDRTAARRALESAVASRPDQISLYFLGLAYAADGDWAAGASLLERARERAPMFSGVRSSLAYAYERLGRGRDAGAIRASLREGGDVNLMERALNEGMTGNVDQAYEMLRGSGWATMINTIPVVINLRTNPLLAAFRTDPRYGALLREVGLDR